MGSGFDQRDQRVQNQINVAIALPAPFLPSDPPFMAPHLPHELVDRSELMASAVVKLLSGASDERTVALTTALHGAGGLGKTTLAAQVCHKLKAEFPAGILWVTIGQQTRGAELAAKINDLSFHLCGMRPTLVDPEQAGHHLGRLLGEEQRLLVIDDIWWPEQLAPFLVGGARCTRLVTTRIPSVLPNDCDLVQVDAMTETEAMSLLSQGFEGGSDLRELLNSTGRWPVLLQLVNRTVHRWLKRGAAMSEALARVEASLAQDGPSSLDPPGSALLGITDPSARVRAVSSTIEASLTALSAGGADQVNRYLELAVFPEDVVIPQSTLQVYWRTTGGLSASAVERLCLDLADLSLLEEYQPGPNGHLSLHDVLLGYLRRRVGNSRLTVFHRALLDGYRQTLPNPDASAGARTAWWAMGDDEPYFWNHLAHHLKEAGKDGGYEAEELEGLVCDLRWVVAKLQHLGPPAMDSDLTLAGSSLAAKLRQAVAQNAHLLGPDAGVWSARLALLEHLSELKREPDMNETLEALAQVSHFVEAVGPEHTLAATLLARFEMMPELKTIVEPYAAAFSHPRLAPAWVPPDMPHAAFLRALMGHSDWITSLAFSPDGSWLASASLDGTIRLWSPSDGLPRATLIGHRGAVWLIKTSPDSSWLASAGLDKTVRLWNASDGSLRASAIAGSVYELVVSPDGAWLASAGPDPTVRVWDSADGSLRTTLVGRGGPVRALAVSPDGSWLASATESGTVSLWSPADGTLRATATGHSGPVRALAVSPDGSWLASASDDTTVRLWDPSDGSLIKTLVGHNGPVSELAISHDGSWIASGSAGDIRVWNLPDGSMRATLTECTSWKKGIVVSSDSTWLASQGKGNSIQLWDPSDGSLLATLFGHSGSLFALAISEDGSLLASAATFDSPVVRLWDVHEALLDGSTGGINEPAQLLVSSSGPWLASAGKGATIRLQDTTDGSFLATLAGHNGSVRALAVSPDGSWLASGSDDATVRLWSSRDGSLLTTLVGHTGPVWALAVSHDGSWLASGSDDCTVRLWNSTDGSLLAVLNGHSSVVTALAINADDSCLASGSYDNTIRLWNLPESSTRATLVGHGGSIWVLAVCPVEPWLASGSADNTVRLWDLSDGSLRATLVGHTGPVRRLQISPDGGWLASAGDFGGARVWNTSDGSSRTILTHAGGSQALAISPEQSWLAFTRPHNTVCLWDAASDTVVAALRLDSTIHACCWLGSHQAKLCVAGSAGVHALEYIGGSAQGLARIDRQTQPREP